MNNLSYSSQDPEKLAPKVEEIVRADLGAAQPLAYRVVPGSAESASVGSVLGDAFNALVGGRPACLFSVVFDPLSSQRASTLEVRLDRQGVGCHAGVLVFTASLTRPVAAPVALEEPKFFGKSKFHGDDPQAIGKLNGNSELIKRANAFARTEGSGGGLKLEMKRCFQLHPDGAGSSLMAMTFARYLKMGMSATTDAKEFLELVELLEKTL